MLLFLINIIQPRYFFLHVLNVYSSVAASYLAKNKNALFGVN